MRGFHVLFNTRPSSGHSIRCHLPFVLVKVAWYGSDCFGVLELEVLLHTEAVFCQCWLIWHVRLMCWWCSFTWHLSGMLHTSGFVSPGRPSQADRNSGIVLRSRLTNLMLCLASIPFMWLKIVGIHGRNVKEVVYSRGWVKFLHLEV